MRSGLSESAREKDATTVESEDAQRSHGLGLRGRYVASRLKWRYSTVQYRALVESGKLFRLCTDQHSLPL